MPKQYKHLTLEERYQIAAYLKAGFTKPDIADHLNRHISTIKRELKNNTGLRGYRPKQAHRLAQNRHKDKPKPIKMTIELCSHISSLIQEQWSPEQIQGRMILKGYNTVCPATIYSFIRHDKATGGDLYKHLRHKRYKRRSASPDNRGKIKNIISIDERPEIVDEKTRLGDWEADTVIGKGHKGVLVTLSERYSKLNLVAHVGTKHAGPVTQAIIDMLKPYKGELKTITFDNGKEFAYHETIKEVLEVETYFAHPYSSWERGLNENHNGLIRQYLPKGEPLDKVNEYQVLEIQLKLNNRPRKLLKFKTPAEVYQEMVSAG